MTRLDWLRTIALPARSSEDELAFRRYYQQRSLPMARTGCVISIILILVVCLFDWLLAPRELAVDTIRFRFATMIPAVTAALVLSILRPKSPAVPYAFMGACAVSGVSTIVVGALAAKAGVEFVAWGTIFATVVAYLVFGLRFRLAALAGWPLFLTYVFFGLSISMPIEKFAYGALFLVSTNVVGMYTNFLLEKDARELFAQTNIMRNLARTDGLTGIDNRRTFDEHLDEVWRQARRENHMIGVLLIDIDHFKLYNDCYGHQSGDQCIQAVADVLASSVNRPLDQVARYGGEEFAIVLYNPTHEFVEAFASRIVERVRTLNISHKASDIAKYVTVSVGATIVHPVASMRPSMVVRSADDALYESKNKGRNRSVVFYLDGDLRATRTLKIVNA